jgi:hypothetical protein
LFTLIFFYSQLCLTLTVFEHGVKEPLHPLQMATCNHVAMDASWTRQEADRFGGEQSWKELSSTCGTLSGNGRGWGSRSEWRSSPTTLVLEIKAREGNLRKLPPLHILTLSLFVSPY